jgi:hypothetical protein
MRRTRSLAPLAGHDEPRDAHQSVITRNQAPDLRAVKQVRGRCASRRPAP